MGTWGCKINQNDTSDDVVYFYKQQLREGLSDEQAYQNVILINDIKDDIEDEDYMDFWLGLASVMYEYGRLTEEVKKKAMDIIDSGYDEARFTGKNIQKRKAVLEEFKKKLESPQPERKAIKIPKPRITKFKPGEVYYFQIDCERSRGKWYDGKYIVLKVEGLTEEENVDYPQVNDICPVLNFYFSDKELTSPEVKDLIRLKNAQIDNEIEYRYVMWPEYFKKFSSKLVYVGINEDHVDELITFSDKVQYDVNLNIYEKLRLQIASSDNLSYLYSYNTIEAKLCLFCLNKLKPTE